MDSPQADINREVFLSQEKIELRAIGAAAAPKLVAEALTMREALKRFPILHTKLVYAAARDGYLHPIRPQGRVLYPEWELRMLVKRLYRSGFDQERRVA